MQGNHQNEKEQRMVNIMENNQITGIKVYASQASKLRRKESIDSRQGVSDSLQDRVLLSPAAKEIQAAKSLLQDIPDIRSEKVSEIKFQISQGTYSISSDKIAHRLIGESMLNALL